MASRILSLAFAAVFVGSCASAEKIHSLRSGMLSSEVSDEVGNPETIRRRGEQVVWYYRTDEVRCAVVFDAEKVSGWACAGDERGDESLKPGAQTASAALEERATVAPTVFVH